MSDTYLTNEFAEALSSLLASGYKLPLTLAGISVNGVAFVATYTQLDADSLECEFKLEPKGYMKIPINLMVVDARGEAARVVIGSDALMH
jgi:hypothetical protein